MRIRVDRDSDALFFRLSEREIEESEEVSPGVVLDYDAEGRLVGLEVLGVRERFSAADLSQVQVDLPSFAAG